MKTFIEVINESVNEMAYISGKLDSNQHSKKSDWDNFYKSDKQNLELITGYIPNFRLYKHGNTNYFLTDKEDNYKGHIQLNHTSAGSGRFKTPVQVISSNQDGSVKGFYNVMFTNILTHTHIDAIFSDGNLSTNAVNSYERLNNSNVKVLKYKQQTDEYYSLSSNSESIEDTGIIYVVTPYNTKIELVERYNNYVNNILNKSPYIHEYYKEESQVLFMVLYSSRNALYEDLI